MSTAAATAAAPTTGNAAAALPMGREAGWTHRRDHDAMRRSENAHFDTYYRDHQRIVKDAAEFDELMAVLRTPLPSTLWINDTDPLAQSIADHFTSLGSELMVPIPWYPIPGMAWQINVDKKRFRKDPELLPLRQYLIRQTAMGTTSRQEAVSMIPPFLLEIGPNDRCLDMCASPGSKTAQMMAILGRQKLLHGQSRGGGVRGLDYTTGGCVVANEKDEKRANMLVYQVRRLRQLFPFALFVNHDARFLPDLEDPVTGQVVKYDKILCDVVCTGDGTLRKAPGLFMKWRSYDATNLQRIQIQIALRGCHLVKVGGRFVYSTCSMNPIENEAVVTQVLKRTNGAMRLVEPRGIIAGLSCDAGLSHWKVVSAKGEVATQPGEYQMHEACFPPTAEEAATMHLERCMRFLPKHCNGGCFFIAVFEKVGEYEQPPLAPQQEAPSKRRPRAEGTEEASKLPPATTSEAAEGGAASSGDSPAAATAGGAGRSTPLYLPSFPDAKAYLESFIGARGFPTDLLYSRALAGATELKVTLGSQCNLVSRDVKALLDGGNDKLIVVAAGLRALAVETLTKTWRVAHEIGPILDAFIDESPRLLTGIPSDIAQLCGPESTANGVALDKIEREEVRERVTAMPIGCCIMRVDSTIPGQRAIPVAVMRARNRFQLLVDKDDLDDLKCRLNIGGPLATTEDAD